MTSVVLCCLISLECQARRRGSHAENAKKGTHPHRSFRYQQHQHFCLGSGRNTLTFLGFNRVYLHKVCVYSYKCCVFEVFALIACWITVRMHILSLAVILFSLSHMRPQLPGWEHDYIIIPFFCLLTDIWQVVKPCLKTWTVLSSWCLIGENFQHSKNIFVLIDLIGASLIISIAKSAF